MIVGKIINEIRRDRAIPALIIHPKFIIGLIFEIISDENPAMVVTMAKNVGVALVRTVKRTILWLEALGYFAKSSL